MSGTSHSDCLNRPEILRVLFHPRSAPSTDSAEAGSLALNIPVSPDIVVGGRYHLSGSHRPTVLFFHGNGEIAADYVDIGPLYTGMGINFMVVDYRGYGTSTGNPSADNMLRDCHAIFDHLLELRKTEGQNGSLVVMGRSLGSASALELAATRQEEIDGLIIESGFAETAPLLRCLGVDPDAFGFDEAKGFRNIDKIRSFANPILIIHAEYDHLIPYSQGRALYDAAVAREKRLVKIQGANHNDILFRGLNQYLSEVNSFILRLSPGNSG